MFEDETLVAKRRAAANEGEVGRAVIGKPRKYGDETERLEPGRYIRKQLVARWAESRAKLSLQQQNTLRKKQNDERLGIAKQVGQATLSEKEIQK